MESIKRKNTKEHMTFHSEKKAPYLTFPALEAMDGIVHGFSTRLGGVSREHLSSMNLSFSRGDDPECVRENFRRIGESIGFEPENLVFSMQTHTVNVRKVTKEDRGRGFLYPVGYQDVDGLVTNDEDVILATFYADCVPLFFVDPVKRAVGLSHSGWKGTVGKIGKATVEMMVKEFGSDPGELIAAIGPSICQDCYEVSEDVILQFQEAFSEKDWGDLYYKKENGKYQLNLWNANRLVFLEAGIRPEHIVVTDLCTACNPDLLFSHRASQGKRGNLAAFLGLKDLKIRMAKESDAEEMLEIYRPYVEQTAVTFEYETPSGEEFRKRIRKVLEEFPWLVYEENGEILGYAYAAKYHERAAFQWTAELSVYLKETARKKGIGKKLYEELFCRLRAMGIYKVYAHITWPNEDSVAFHEKLGFVHTARFPKTGYKLGKWRDTIFMEKLLAELPEHPNLRI